MIVKDEVNEIDIDTEILGKFFSSRHILLIVLANREELKIPNTATNLSEAFDIRIENIRTILGRLKKDKLVKRGEQIDINGVSYSNYRLTKEAKRCLKILAENVYRLYNME